MQSWVGGRPAFAVPHWSKRSATRFDIRSFPFWELPRRQFSQSPQKRHHRPRILLAVGQEVLARLLTVDDFRLIYRAQPRVVEILTVVHGARDFSSWRLDR